MIEKKRYTYLNASRSSFIGSFFCNDIPLKNQEVVELLKENEQLKSELFETKEVLKSIERDRNQTLLVCKKYEGFFKEKGYDIHDLIDYARDGGND